jgi:LmbE family N-acetylglucosaminyl deacetylase
VNILFVLAHPDDEAYGPYGTMSRMVAEGHKVTLFCLCNGERPGFEQVAADRVFALKANCEHLGIEWKIWNNSDLSLELNDTAHLLTQLFAQHKPEVVYTHNISDINHDHRVLADAVMIASRPKPDSTVNQLYFFEVPSSTDWTFNQLTPAFQPTTYVDISDYIDSKKQALARYRTETYEFPDARSIEAMTTLAKYRGYQVGLLYAEAFRLVFDRVRRSQ